MGIGMDRTVTWDVAVVGSVNTDFLVRGPKLPTLGETARGETFHESMGGKGANQAVAAARLGARVTFVCRFGSDTRGTSAEGCLAAERVDLSFAVRDLYTPTGAAIIMVDHAGEKQIVVAPGANDRLDEEQIERAAPALGAANVVLCQLEVPLETVAAAFRLARAAGARTVLDPAPAVPLPDALLLLVDVIRPNAHEAGVLTGVEIHGRASARRAAECLLDRGVGAVAVQAGPEGNLVVTRGEEHFYPKVPVTSVDATGAGDAFAGTLAVMLAEGRTLAEAGAYANAAAALATTAVGAQEGLPTRQQICDLLARFGTLPTG
jgi:ribokinase